MKKFLIVVPVILVAAAMIYSATKAGDRKGVLLPIATIPASAKSAAQPTPVANSGDEPNRAPHSTVEGEAREFPSIEPARDEHDQPAFVTAEKYFEYVSADSMWGMTAEEIAAWQRNKHRRSGRKTRDYFDTIATGEFSTGMFDFDVTYRSRPGETTVSIINLDVRNEATPSAHEALLNALTEAHGSGDKAINDENIGALLMKSAAVGERKRRIQSIESICERDSE